MDSPDRLHRFIFDKIPIRGEFVHLKKTYQTIVSQHTYPSSIKKLLGEALCVATLLSAIIKFDGRLTVQFRGKGKLTLLLAQCNNQFELRGLVKGDKEITYDELMKSFEQGVLVIMLDMGAKSKKYQGIVEWKGNSLAESIEGYFEKSEQLLTQIWLTVTETSAAGLLLQITPGGETEDRKLTDEEIKLHWEHILNLTSTLDSKDMIHLDYQDLLRKLYPDEIIRIFESNPVSFKCTCSRKSGEDAISILGKEQAFEELNNKQSIVVTCDFCNAEYVFDRADVEKIFDNQLPTDGHLH